MDAGVVVLWIIGTVAGLIVVGGLLFWLASCVYYFDHK